MGTWWGEFACDDCWELPTSLNTTGLPWSSAVETSGKRFFPIQSILLKHTIYREFPVSSPRTKHFKYLPGSDPRHPLQARQIG